VDAAGNTHCHIGFERFFPVSLIEVVMPFVFCAQNRGEMMLWRTPHGKNVNAQGPDKTSSGDVGNRKLQ